MNKRGLKQGQNKRLKIFSLHSKRAQMHLSFGMIFSIILIIVFIAFAFYAIMKLLDLTKNVTVRQFEDSLKKDIDALWKGTGGSQEVEYKLPEEITYVCFVDYSIPRKGSLQNLYTPLKRAYTGYENLFFYPLGASKGSDPVEITHLDMGTITSTDNPLCIENLNGKVKMTLSKNYGEALVMLKK